MNRCSLAVAGLACVLAACSPRGSDGLGAQDRFEQARGAFLRDQLDSAIGLLQRAAEAEPNRAEVHYWLGRISAEKAMRVGLIRSFFVVRRGKVASSHAVALEPDNPDYLEFQTDVLSALPGILGGNRDSALVLAMRLHRLDTARGSRKVLDVLWRGNDKWRARHDSIVETISRSTASDRTMQLMIGAYCRANCRERALAIYQRLVERDSMDAYARFAAGRALIVLGREPRRAQAYLWPAARGLERPLDFGPSYVRFTAGAPWWRLGLTYVQLGMPDSARICFEEALRVNPELEVARRSLDSLSRH
ncbi:MAG: tetratricopeptide repeat protein [Gemmatimonadales bacterium]|nr:tetratricopeptide repeat protein [Gemmatimonadales bacterium]